MFGDVVGWEVGFVEAAEVVGEPGEAPSHYCPETEFRVTGERSVVGVLVCEKKGRVLVGSEGVGVEAAPVHRGADDVEAVEGHTGFFPVDEVGLAILPDDVFGMEVRVAQEGGFVGGA